MNSFVESVSQAAGTPLGNDIINLIMQSGPVAKFVLLVLLIFSLASWGIMLDKWLQFRRNNKAADKFFLLFRQAKSFEDVTRGLKKLSPDPLSRIYLAGYRALKKIENLPSSTHNQNTDKNTRIIELAIDDAITTEIQILEKRLQFLGTCGSVTPFIGLFGTVWGIINAFHKIGMAGSASIAAVAPGISEALIATAAGLAAAIPAVIGFNHFLGKIRISSGLFDKFRTNFLASLE